MKNLQFHTHKPNWKGKTFVYWIMELGAEQSVAKLRIFNLGSDFGLIHF